MTTILDKLTMSETAAKVEELRGKIAAMREHRVFTSIKTIEDLRYFMQTHVYAVWDFMMLAKRLQFEYTGMRPMWVPPGVPKSARTVNEIVTIAETDEDGKGGMCSHFELYLRAMEEIDADVATVSEFAMNLRFGLPAPEAAARALLNVAPEVKGPILHYVTNVTGAARTGLSEEVLAYFIFGNDDVVQSTFHTLLNNLGDLKQLAPTFEQYLLRSTELNVKYWNGATDELLLTELEQNPIRTNTALNAAIQVVTANLYLWECAAQQIEKKRLAAS